MLVVFVVLASLPVDDGAGVLSEAAQHRLAEDAQRLEERTGVALGIVTRPSLDGQDIAALAKQQAAAWPKANRGVLVVVATSEKRLQLEVGYALDDLLPEKLRAQIIKEAAPYLAAADWDNGLSLVVSRLIDEVRSSSYALVPEAVWPPAREEEQDRRLPLLGGGLLVVVLGAAAAWRRRSKAEKARFGGGSAIGRW